MVYENGTQKLLLTEEGYVTLADTKYHYYLKDHQGNNRVVISQSGTVEETNHYYPFGGVFAATDNVQPYKYNGKELDTKNGLNWYDYGARHYDAALGRFVSVDPLSEKYFLTSPYGYCLNNPIMYIDPEGEYVVVSKPGAEVVWHGEGEPVKVKEAKMRGETSYGMICSSSEVYLMDFFPMDNEDEIIDLKGITCKPGDNISDIVEMNDTVLEIDNKSLSNRPDLWGHYGIARELSAIYNVPLKSLPKYELDKNIPEYSVEIEEQEKCNRYVAVEIEGIYEKESPIWMKSLLSKAGQRPINAIVDITNYVMMVVGQPLHAFDRTHVRREKIIVRNAKEKDQL